MDSHASTPAGEAESRPQTPSHANPSGRSRISPPWWLTREPSRWDQARLHCTCAALHAREVARELWRALYAGACADRWPRRWWAGVIAAALVLTLGVMLSGCAWVPSALRIGGTPIERVEKREDKEDAARGKLLRASQEAAHKAADALAVAPDSRPVVVARDFACEATASLDQALGAPAAGEAGKWQDLVRRLVSEDAAIRATAEKERNADRAEIARLGERLAEASAATVRAEEKALKYAAEVDRIADMLRKVVWIAGGVAALWVLSQVLSIAGRLNPAFAGVAAMVNTVAAPAVQFAFNRAKKGLQKVGSALAEADKAKDAAADKIRAYLDVHTDADHQAVIAEACAASGGGGGG